MLGLHLPGSVPAGNRSISRHLRPRVNSRIETVATLALAFLLGVAASHAHGHYVRQADCQRWRDNVTRWTQVVADATGELNGAETTALTLAHGALIAVRDHECRS
jgi:hypothetical protein